MLVLQLHKAEQPQLYFMQCPSSIMLSLHFTDVIPPQYWAAFAVAALNVLPPQVLCYPFTVLMISIHSTEETLLYRSYPPQLSCHPSNCTEQPPLHSILSPASITLSLCGTDSILHLTDLIPNKHHVSPPQYKIASTVLNVIPPNIILSLYCADFIP